MAKYISIFFFTILVSVILFFLIGIFFSDGDTILIFGTITILLLSFLISLMFYLIDLVKRN